MTTEAIKTAIVRDVAYHGFSFGEAAEKYGVTRNVVAGLCHRAGVKIGGMREKHRAKIGVLTSRRLFQWHRSNPEKTRQISQAMNIARRKQVNP